MEQKGAAWRKRVCAFLTVVALLAAAKAPAHHSLAIYTDESRTLDGEIVDVLWANPHIRIRLKTVAPDGQTQVWSLEGGSLDDARARGRHERTVPRRATRVKAAVRVSERDPLRRGRDERAASGRPRSADVDRRPGLFHGRRIGSSRRGIASPAIRPVRIAAFSGSGACRPRTPPAPRRWSACRSLRPRSLREPRSTCSTTSRPAASRRECRGFSSTRTRSSSSTAGRRSPSARSSTTPSGRSTWTAPSRRRGSPRRGSATRWAVWEGEDLVVTTSRVSWPFFDNRGTPQSSAVRIVERYSLSEEQSRLDFRVTVTDPSTFTAPAVIDGHWLALGGSIPRYDCQPR